MSRSAHVLASSNIRTMNLNSDGKDVGSGENRAWPTLALASQQASGASDSYLAANQSQID